VARTKVFVSYSHEDGLWLNKVAQHIAVLERRGLVELWSDVRIEAGADWAGEIEIALSSARIAVLLVSPAFLASEFIWAQEMPRIAAHAALGMDALPLIVRPCAWRLEEFLAQLNARPTDGRPLSLGSEGQVDADLSAFAYELAAKVGRSPAAISFPEVASVRGVAPFKEGPVDLTGDWEGFYNSTLALRLIVRESNGASFRGRIEYPSNATMTNVEGVIHQSWSFDDEIWAQINNATSEGYRIAVSF
jgi:hypothetical protein